MRLMLAFALLASTSIASAQVSPEMLKAPGRSENALKADAGRKPVEVLGFLGVKPGDRALDFLAGGGYYAELLGKAVGPKGRVTAYELPIGEDGESVKLKDSWAKLQQRNPNVTLVAGDTANPTWAPASFDFALFHLTYHDLYWESAKYHYPRVEPDRFLKVLFAAMKPGGIVGVVDHVAAPGDTRANADKYHRIDPATVKADFRRAGFELVGESPLLMTGKDDHAKEVFDPAVRGMTDRFVFRFRKPG